MENTIALSNLLFAFVPVLLVLIFYYRWSLNFRHVGYALFRMLMQLLLVGYALAYIFVTDLPLVIVFILMLMVVISSWISLNVIEKYRSQLFFRAVVAIAVGGGVSLICVSYGVLMIKPWYSPQILVPLGGMAFASAMTSISLCAERFFAEKTRTDNFEKVRSIAFNAGMIPVVNSLFAVGLVSLPGMMTGQILSGVSPLIASRYQIMVMCMVFSASGLSTALFLVLLKSYFPFKERK